MLLDPARLDPGRVYDFCVVGTGPAGITLALKLAGKGKTVLLLEAGGLEFSDESQDAFDGEVAGDPYMQLRYARLRQFGGTSGHWGGMCRTLDAIDFEFKKAFPLAHWPISKSTLDPYAKPAFEILELPAQAEDREIPGAGIKEIYFTTSNPAVRFGEKYRKVVLDSDGITLCLNATVICLKTGGESIVGLVVQLPDGRKREARAREYVLACGGIENSRILLWSNAQSNSQVVKDSSALGSYWMEHPHFTVGEVLVGRPEARDTPFSLTREKQLELGVLNCGLRLVHDAYETRDRAKRLIADLLCVAPDLGAWALKRFGKNLICGARLVAAWEQEPRRESRIELSANAVDRFGMPRAVLYWKKSPRDLETARKTAMEFGRYLVTSGKGRLRLQGWALGKEPYPVKDELGGFHHMGGTRMSDKPGEGVVDSNLRVWGQDNLYVCGSSVFPAAGHANPTLTIVQLALRLADHLQRGAPTASIM